MIKALYFLSKFWRDNGTIVTFGLANLALIGFCFWKLFTNHLTHIGDDIKANGEKITILDTTVKEMDKDVRKVSERVAKVEGKLEK